MHNNDLELRLPCKEGTRGKDSQIALVKIRKSMTKANRKINGSFLKEVKSRKVFEGKKNFPYDLGKAESCHNLKRGIF